MIRLRRVFNGFLCYLGLHEWEEVRRVHMLSLVRCVYCGREVLKDD
jgi:hypothetical protein